MDSIFKAMRKVEVTFQKHTGREPEAFRVHPTIWHMISGDGARQTAVTGITWQMAFRGIPIIADPDTPADVVAAGIYYRRWK